MDNLTVTVEDDKDGEAEALGIAQSLEHGLGVLLLRLVSGLAWVIVDMNVDKVVIDNFHDIAVLADEVGKSEAPGAPVAAHLTDNELVFLGSFGYGSVNLCHGIDGLVVDFLQ